MKEQKRCPLAIGGMFHGWYPVILAVTILPSLVMSATLGFLSPAIQRQLAESRKTEEGKADVPLLLRGKPVESDISAGQLHSYHFTLDSSQYLRLLFGHRDLRLTFTVSGPGGKLTQINSSRDGPTRVSVIAAVSGDYQLQVRSLEKDEVTRRYQVSIDDLRKSTTGDQNHIRAEKAFAEAEQLRREWKVESLRLAIKKYGDAQSYWRGLGYQPGEADVLVNMSDVYFVLNNYQKALYCAGRALALDRASKNLRGEAEALNRVGYVYVWLDRYKEALDQLEKAITISRTLDDKRLEAQALNNLGEAHHYLNEEQKALVYFEGALSLWQVCGDRRGQAQTLLNLGNALANLADMQKALNLFDQSMPLWKAIDDLQGQARTLQVIGFIHILRGDGQKGLEVQHEASSLFRAMGDQSGEASTLSGIGRCYEDLGEMRKAVASYERSLQLFRAVGDSTGVRSILVFLGHAYSLVGEAEAARLHFNESLLLSRSAGDRRTEAYALNEIGTTFKSLDRGKALHSYTQALSLRQEVGDRRGEAETLDDLGQLFDLSGDQQKALASYRQALGLRRAVEDRGGEAATLYNIARIEREKGNLDEARSHIEAACALVETLRTRVVSQELRASYLASTHQQYELYVDVLMRLHRQRPSEALDAAAFHASELARARTLIEMLAEGRADIRQGVEPALLDSERSLNQLLSDKTERYSRLLANAHTEKQAAAAAIEIEGIKNDYQEIQARIRSSSPRYAALTQPQPLSVRQLQQQVLDQETILLEYALGDERSYLWAITADSLASFDLPKRADIEAEARRVYRLLTSRHKTVDGETERRKAARVASDELKYQEEAANLSRILLGPVSSQLGTKRLVIVADGALQYIPFGALPAPPAEGFGQARTLARSDIDEAFRPYSRPLIVEHEIVSLPSATTLAVMRRELADRKPAPRAVAVLADPVFSRFDPRVISSRAGASRQDDVSTPRDLERAIKEVRISRNRNEVARLPFSRAEAAAIKAASGGQAMEAVDFEASRATAMSDKLSQYRVIHFATHGLLNSEHPEMSGIVFSLVDRHGKSQNGFLRLHDLYNLNLPAELVVLSACQTALGKDVKGEGLVGLTRGFMYAGAARVVASLWQVDDSATAGLMQRFYSKMLEDGLRPSAALRDAQVEMWNQKRWHAPYYWAGFVLQGEWK